MRLIKKNQVVIYVIALMLVVAGYLNFTTNGDLKSAVQTASSEEELEKMANIGDAQLVSSNVISENALNNNVNNSENIKKNETSTDETTSNNETVSTSSTTVKNDDDYFKKSKLERDTMYSQMIETYEKILNSANSLETQKQSASEEIKKINNTKNSIMICENLIATKGFDKCIVFVNGESVSAIIGAQELKQEEISQIQNILSRELNAKIENIHISLK